MYNSYPGMNPYLGYQQQNIQQQIVKVNGQNGAKAYNLPANSSILMLDEYDPVVWVKITDGAGYPTITKYRIEECKPEASPEYVNLENRIKRLEDVINGKSYSSDDEQKEQTC